MERTEVFETGSFNLYTVWTLRVAMGYSGFIAKGSKQANTRQVAKILWHVLLVLLNCD